MVKYVSKMTVKAIMVKNVCTYSEACRHYYGEERRYIMVKQVGW